MISWLTIILAGVGSFFLTGVLRRYALTRGLLDIPNKRSSHEVPTPRGGGAAIVLSFLAGLTILLPAGFLSASFFWGVLGSGGLVALTGWLDDQHDIKARYRLMAHFSAAAWALFWLGGLPPLPVFGTMIDPGWLGHAAAAFYLVWLLNLYNFMDGIDGIAGMEAVSVCLGGAVLYFFSSAQEPGIWLPPMLLAGACAGFLVWNFPRARIFMGDVGSGFLGIILGFFSFAAGWAVPELFWGWAILLGAFIVDSTVTLVRRSFRGKKIYKAHKSHAYQHAARIYGHTKVSLAFAGINMLWLLPLALLVVSGILEGALGMIIAYAPLAAAALLFRAGRGDPGPGL